MTGAVEQEAVAEPLVAETAQHYGVGPHYARAYLEYWQRARQRSYGSLAEIRACEPPYPMWFDFAMSTNQRAGQFRDFLRPFLGAVHGGRYLDVGCGFGGYLRAFAELGMTPTGIEIDPDRVALSRANARDGELGDCVRQLDVLADGAAQSLGRFRLITCIDVIEHVLDVPLALRRMSELLEPGGVLCLEIPNRDSIDFVGSDGHFNLFGITQLQRPSAQRYHGRFFGFEYDVGHYFPARYYVDRLAEHGVDARYVTYPIHPPRQGGETPRELAKLAVRWLRFLGGPAWKLPAGLNVRVHAALLRYGAGLLGRGAAALAGSARRPFQARYLTNFWCLLGRKA